ncbi:MAG: cellulose biosynthesis cyclic di-GMP-binding regulatory protein BcsB [Rhodospirillaceae bacterium]|nr:cellulose biosynthesis cyclic di-GMP-binding regulatory protein BcsB [Rhodospirillaceae bacterium]
MRPGIIFRAVVLGILSFLCTVLVTRVLLAAETSSPKDNIERKLAVGPEKWVPTVSRTFTLDNLGFSSPLLFSGAELNRQIFFPIPRDLPLQSAEIDLTATYVRSNVGHMTFLTSLNDTPVFAFEPTAAEGAFQRTIQIPVNNGRPRGDFITLGLNHSTVTSENRCSEQRSIANVVTVSPDSALHYSVAAKDVADVNTAWRILPQATRILIPNRTLTADEYRTALRIAIALADTRRTAAFVTIPNIGDVVDGVQFTPPAALARARSFAKFNAPRVKLETAADRAAYGILLSMQGQTAFGDAVVGYDWLKQILDQDIAALRAELAADGAEKALDAWIAAGLSSRKVNAADNLKLDAIYGQPVVVFDSENASAPAGLVGSMWSTLAQNASLTVDYASEAHDTRTWIPLTDLSPNLNAQAVIEYGEWLATFSASKLPQGRWPTTIELEVRISPDASDALPVLSVMLNDVLLRAERVEATSDIVRLTADIPSYLLGSVNTVRVAVQRATQSGDCRALSRGYMAQVMPTSRLVLSDVKIDDQFFGLKSQFSKTGTVAVPQDYLADALNSLPYVHAFIYALGITPTSLRINVFDQAKSFAPFESFIAFGMKLPGLRQDIVVENGELKLQSKDGGEAVQVKGAGNMAVAQITNLRDYAGVTINSVTGKPFRDVKVDSLAAGDIAVFGSTGQVLLLGDDDYRVTSIRRALLEPSAIFHRYSVWIVSGLSILGMLIFMRLVRAFLDRRKRMKAAAAAAATEVVQASG